MIKMEVLAPLVVAIPLLVAAFFACTSKVLPRFAADLLALCTSGVVMAFGALLLQASAKGTLVYWFGGWKPIGPAAIGIAFVIDPVAAGLVIFIAFLVTAAFIFAWRFFESVGALFHTLMTIFLAAMSGFCLSGDLFTLFVFFELMSVAAFALTAHKIESASIEGALNFAITNTIGALSILCGIALIYGRTGALNLAQIGRALPGLHSNQLITIAFSLLACGFLIKAAAVPFHFWLADAHAVAPTPVCVLFSGIMVELGVYGVFRLYWAVFDPVLHPCIDRVRLVFIVLGAITSIVGGLMCFWQRHIKRLLAFSTVAHVGMLLTGAGTLTAQGVAGAGLYLIGHGMVKGSLFMTTGMLLQKFGTVDELRLHGRAGGMNFIGIAFAVAGLGLAGFPPFGTFMGKALMEESAKHFGQAWVPWLFIIISALTGATVLRVAGWVFLGWGRTFSGDVHSPTVAEERETRGGRQLPGVMIAASALLAFLPASSGLLPGLAKTFQAAAERFTSTADYANAVLAGAFTGPIHATQPANLTASGLSFGFGAAVATVALALAGLFHAQLPGIIRGPAKIFTHSWSPLRHLHSGDVRDYVAWLSLGASIICAVIALVARHAA